MIFTKPGIVSAVLGVLLVLTQSNCAASAGERHEWQQEQAQQQPPPTPATAQNSQPGAPQASPAEQSTAKQRKIWTNEDLVLLRTPADIYLLEKEEREAAEAEAAAKLAAEQESHQGARLEFKLPATIEETQQLIKDKEAEISDTRAKRATLTTEMQTVTDEQREAKQTEINIVAAQMELARNELKALQDHLVELQKLPASEAPATPQPPPSI
jgi:chromosome segregation ATPase